MSRKMFFNLPNYKKAFDNVPCNVPLARLEYIKINQKFNSKPISEQTKITKKDIDKVYAKKDLPFSPSKRITRYKS